MWWLEMPAERNWQKENYLFINFLCKILEILLKKAGFFLKIEVLLIDG